MTWIQQSCSLEADYKSQGRRKLWSVGCPNQPELLACPNSHDWHTPWLRHCGDGMSTLRPIGVSVSPPWFVPPWRRHWMKRRHSPEGATHARCCKLNVSDVCTLHSVPGSSTWIVSSGASLRFVVPELLCGSEILRDWWWPQCQTTGPVSHTLLVSCVSYCSVHGSLLCHCEWKATEAEEGKEKHDG